MEKNHSLKLCHKNQVTIFQVFSLILTKSEGMIHIFHIVDIFDIKNMGGSDFKLDFHLFKICCCY